MINPDLIRVVKRDGVSAPDILGVQILAQSQPFFPAEESKNLKRTVMWIF